MILMAVLFCWHVQQRSVIGELMEVVSYKAGRKWSIAEQEVNNML